MNDTGTIQATPSAPASTIGDAAASLASVDASSASPPETTATPDAGATAAIAPTGESTPDPGVVSTESDPTPTGPIPFEAHKRALENARAKATEQAKAEARKELDAQHAWSQKIPESARHERTADFVARLNTEPVGAIRDLVGEALRHPTFGPQVASELARHLSSMRGQRPPAEAPAPEPEADLQGPDGTLVYSASQLKKWQQWNQARERAELQKEIAPLKQMRDQVIQQAQERQAWDTSRSQLEAMRAKPHFKEHELAIKELMTANDTLSLTDAYTQILLEKVIPGLSATTESKVLADLQQKAVASTHNPASATTTTPRSVVGDARAALEQADALLGVR
jgi:hypothetical protein